MNTNERILRNESCRACRTERKKTDAVLEHDGHPAGLQRGAHRAAHVDVRVVTVPADLMTLRRQAPAQLGDHTVHGREILERPRRQRAV
jgi:hypothetical protein